MARRKGIDAVLHKATVPLRPRRLLTFVFVAAATRTLWALDPGDPLERYGRQTWQTESGLPQNTVNAISQTSDGYLWFGTDGGLVRFDSYRFQTFDTQNSPALGSNHIRALHPSAGNALTIVTASGTVTYRRGVFEPTRTPIETPPANLNTALRDREGTLWVGTASGLLRVENGTRQSFPPGDPLAQDAILSLFEDREGDLWVGTDANGVTMLRDQKFFSYAAHTELLDGQIRCVLSDPNGTVWLGTDGQGLLSMRNGVASPAPFNRMLASAVIVSLARSSTGDLLVGTPDGLNRVHGSQVTLQTVAEGLPDDFIRSIYADADGSVWISTRRGLAHAAAGKVTTYTQANGLGSDLVGSVSRDKRGQLWVATLHGLSHFENDGFRNYTVDDGLSSNVVTDLYLDRLGDLWAATEGGGVDLVRGDSFTHVAAGVNGPATVLGIQEDDAGHFWLASPNGVFKSDAGAWRQHGSGAAVPYGTGDGLRVRECSSGGHPEVTRASDGSIWFAMVRGAAQLPSTHTADRSARLPLVLESIAFDGRSGSRMPDKVPATTAHVAFDYAALSFAAPQKVQYRYKLEGLDRDWIFAGTRRTADYTNLPPGQLAFRVQAEAGDGLWDQNSLTFRFTVEPHYYQTWWFRVACAAAAALMFYLIYFYRLRQVRLQHAAVLAERNRIAREIHDTLAQGFVGVSVQLELVARLLDNSISAAREQLNEARAQVRSSIADARRSIWELRSQSSEQHDFASRLSSMSRQVSAASPVRVTLDVHGAYRQLDSKLEDELLRIAQEAITNAVRHASATEVKLELFFQPRKVKMTVTDNGRGFDPAAQTRRELNGHYGLQGMQERAQNVGANLAVTSMEGKGTTITVEVPVK